MTDLAYLSATDALELFRARELSPVELMAAVTEQCDVADGSVNALAETLFDEAFVAAKEAENAYAAGDYAGRPLLGLPVATKEKHAIAGRTLSNGLSFEAGTISPVSHPVVQRIQAAGGIVHARTTTPEYSCATITHSPLWGVTRNPWNLAYSPGGSSGGAGAALAAGMATLATASDIAGSTRLPACFTGTVGYKPPYGRIPGAGVLAADWYRSDGPMARTVADTALLADVMSGGHPGDHASIGWTPPELSGPFGSVEGMRVALSITLGDYRVTPDVEANTRRVAEALATAGCVVEEVALPWHTRETSETIFTHFGTILGPTMAAVAAGHENELACYTRQFIEDGRAAVGRHSFLAGLESEHRMQAELAAAMRGYDVLLCPTSAIAQLDADGDYLDGITVGGTHLEHYWEAHLTSSFNVNNRCPVLAVPSGMSERGVPTGVQIVGHPYAEAAVFRVGAAVEQALPWAGRRPVLP